MSTQSISYAKAHLAEVIASVTNSNEALVITQNGAPAVVMQSVADYERTQAALALLKLIAMSEADVAHGRTRPQADVFRAARAKLERAAPRKGKRR